MEDITALDKIRESNREMMALTENLKRAVALDDQERKLLKEEVARLREQNAILQKEKAELTEMLVATYRGLKCVQKIQTGTADMSDLVSGLDATLSMLKIAQAADDQSRKGDS